MYAVIQAGSKQHRVTKGEHLKLEKLEGNGGESITFDDVLLVKDGDRLLVGTPNVDGASVSGKILGHGKDKKIHVFTYKRRKNYSRRIGHRQEHTMVEITAIKAPKE